MTVGFIYQFMNGSFKEIGLRWKNLRYHNAAKMVFKEEKNIVCRWIVKIKESGH